MSYTRSYKNAFIAALTLHVLLLMMLFMGPSNTHPVLTADNQQEMSVAKPVVAEQQAEAIKAVSVDSQEVQDTVNRLKEERVKQQQAEANRQRALAQQAEAARKQRIAEQQHLQQLKAEAEKLAIAHKKQLEEEQKHLKQLAQQKVEEEKRLAEMKKQQQAEANALAVLKKKKSDELAKAEQARLAKAKDDLLKKQKAEAEQALAKKAAAQEAATQQAMLDAQKNAQLAGEVDKYKALIINAISQRWILPDNADSSRSSQFRIRLAPNGIVLDVNLTRSSGDPILDRSAQSAIYKASPLPVPSDPATFNLFRDISLTVRPQHARG